MMEGDALLQESFAIYMAEGDVLFKQGEYKKALQSYTTVSCFAIYIRCVAARIVSWAEWAKSELESRHDTELEWEEKVGQRVRGKV